MPSYVASVLSQSSKCSTFETFNKFNQFYFWIIRSVADMWLRLWTFT